MKTRSIPKTTKLSFAVMMVLALLPSHAMSQAAVDANQPQKSLSAYPSTPQAVVEAFIKAGFDVASVYELAGNEDPEERKQYCLEYFSPGWDCLHLTFGYKVVGTEQDANEALVEVVYEDIGAVCTETLQLREMNEEGVLYRLQKHKGLWKIRAPTQPPRISIKTAIELFDFLLGTPGWDERTRRTLKNNITTLKAYLKKKNQQTEQKEIRRWG